VISILFTAALKASRNLVRTSLLTNFNCDYRHSILLEYFVLFTYLVNSNYRVNNMTAINMVAINDSRFGLLDTTSFSTKLALIKVAVIPEGAEKPVSSKAWSEVKEKFYAAFMAS